MARVTSGLGFGLQARLGCISYQLQTTVMIGAEGMQLSCIRAQGTQLSCIRAKGTQLSCKVGFALQHLKFQYCRLEEVPPKGNARSELRSDCHWLMLCVSAGASIMRSEDVAR